MDTKITIFIVVGVLLIGSAFSLSTVHAVKHRPVEIEYTSICLVVGGDQRHQTCTYTDKDGSSTSDCKQDPKTNAWTCTASLTGTGGDTSNPTKDSNIPADLRNALYSSVHKSQNGGLLTGQGSINTPNPPECPATGPIPPNCTMKPPLK